MWPWPKSYETCLGVSISINDIWWWLGETRMAKQKIGNWTLRKRRESAGKPKRMVLNTQYIVKEPG